MKSLTSAISESLTLDKSTTSYSALTDKAKLNAISLISNHEIDAIITDQITFSKDDNTYNDLVTNLRTSYASLIDHLKKDGLINVNGYRIQLKRNI